MVPTGRIVRRAYARGLLQRACELGELDPNTDLDLALDMLVGVVIARAVSGVAHVESSTNASTPVGRRQSYGIPRNFP